MLLLSFITNPTQCTYMWHDVAAFNLVNDNERGITITHCYSIAMCIATLGILNRQLFNGIKIIRCY